MHIKSNKTLAERLSISWRDNKVEKEFLNKCQQSSCDTIDPN